MNFSLKKTRTIIWIWACLVTGILIGKGVGYPWDFLQMPPPQKEYADFRLMKQTYENYKAKFGEEPASLNFLPPYLAEEINKPNSPFTYTAPNGELWYRASSPYYLNKRDLIDWVLGKNKTRALGELIGRIASPTQSK